MANAEMAAAWDGEEGEGWARDRKHYDDAVAGYHRALLDEAAIGSGERVLDVGCGNGQSSRDAARAAVPNGSALGVDLSSRMLDQARELARAEGVANVRFEQADAQVHPFPAGAFDVVISRFGAMFFADPGAAFANLARAVHAGGRLALVAWRSADNEWMGCLRAALAAGRDLPPPPIGVPGPYGLADADRTRSVLHAAGFEAIEITAIRRPFRLGDDEEGAFAYAQRMGIGRGLLRDLDDGQLALALAALRATVAEHRSDEGVVFGSAAWLVAARRGEA